MASVLSTVEEWAWEQFGSCEFGDVRRNRRAVKFAAQVAENCSSSLPQQTKSWRDCKAAYRLIDCDEVTHETLGRPHWERTRARESGEWLLLGDTTEFDFGVHRKVEGLGPTGDGGGLGFLMHSSLLVSTDGTEIVGLAAQELFYRQPVDPGESRHDQLLRSRESEVWGRVIDKVGRPAEGVRFTHVFDRGADNFEVYAHLILNSCDWVVRATHLSRRVTMPNGKPQPLGQYLDRLPACGTYERNVRACGDQPARVAKVELRCGPVLVPVPVHRTPWLREQGITAIAMWVVDAREIDPPADITPLRWTLFTSQAATIGAEALGVVQKYEQRWIIEEYHKAHKTGCQVESRRFATGERLQAITGFLAIVAVRLLQLRSVARSQPNLPAREVVPPTWLTALAALTGRTHHAATVRDFFRDLAGQGGFLGRKRDGEPGWMTIWRGFDMLVIAIKCLARHQKCG